MECTNFKGRMLNTNFRHNNDINNIIGVATSMNLSVTCSLRKLYKNTEDFGSVRHDVNNGVFRENKSAPAELVGYIRCSFYGSVS